MENLKLDCDATSAVYDEGNSWTCTKVVIDCAKLQ